MKKFEKINTAKFQTMERNQMDQAKGGGSLKPNNGTNKKTGDIYDIEDWDFI